MAPEITKKEEYNSGVDVWGCGVLLYEMLTGKAPFSGTSTKQTIEKISKFDMEIHPMFTELSEEARDLVGKILVSDPKIRPSYESILGHPWFSNFT